MTNRTTETIAGKFSDVKGYRYIKNVCLHRSALEGGSRVVLWHGPAVVHVFK